MRAGRWKRCAIVESLAERCVVPTGNFHGIEMQNGRQRVELVQAGHDTSIFGIGQAADVQDEVRAATIDGNLVAGPFDVTISESKASRVCHKRRPAGCMKAPFKGGRGINQ